MRPKCGQNAALKWPKFEIFWPEINPSKFTITQARPMPKLQAQNPTRTMKKVVQPSSTFWILFLLLAESDSLSFYPSVPYCSKN